MGILNPWSIFSRSMFEEVFVMNFNSVTNKDQSFNAVRFQRHFRDRIVERFVEQDWAVVRVGTDPIQSQMPRFFLAPVAPFGPFPDGSGLSAEAIVFGSGNFHIFIDADALCRMAGLGGFRAPFDLGSEIAMAVVLPGFVRRLDGQIPPSQDDVGRPVAVTLVQALSSLATVSPANSNMPPPKRYVLLQAAGEYGGSVHSEVRRGRLVV